MNLIPQGTTPSLRRCILAALMRIANRNGHPQWYAWKTRLLECYAERDGFDTQRYEAPCWTCGGTGVDDMGECFDCNEGVHHVTRTVLTRYVIEGYVFHQLNRTRIDTDEDLDAIEHADGWRNRLTGKKSSKGTSQAASMEAEAWILLLCGGYRTLWRWLCGSGLAYSFYGYPLGTIRALIMAAKRVPLLPQRLRNAWWQWKNRDLPF
jgi:hypothetical protein